MKLTSKWQILILAAAGADTPQRGNVGGGVLSRDVCPDDQMLVGLSGSNPGTSWITHLEAICGTPSLVRAGTDTYRLEFAPGDRTSATATESMRSAWSARLRKRSRSNRGIDNARRMVSFSSSMSRLGARRAEGTT